jgi:hypothetical protein
MKGSLDFKVSRSESAPAEFCLHERCWHDYGRIDSVRRCLEEHRGALLDRIAALDALLASPEPERADRLLLDEATMQVNEVTLRPPASGEAFEAIMRQGWSEKGRPVE